MGSSREGAWVVLADVELAGAQACAAIVAAASQPICWSVQHHGVSQKDGNWEVNLEGSWQEKMTLNSKYQIVGMVRIN